MLIGLGGVWLAWFAGWLNRVELSMRAQATAAALGLVFEREGALPRVVAGGAIGGVSVRVRWRVGWTGRRVDVAWRGQGWTLVPDGAELSEWLSEHAG
ncbi:hypothetical protein LBMAG42_30200 [Deltaproteobacteria bacterium]|nr:hypothetical protein LBMAG42_30200 [Deltaproteobacteria bacterium]